MLVYLITNLINKKIYIGQTINHVAQRQAVHKHRAKLYSSGNYGTNSYLYNAICKYGFDNFKFEVIEDFIETQEELDLAEIWWIFIYRSINRDIGYNISPGGNGKGRVSDETRKKISEANKGEKSFQYGKSPSLETRAKLSKANKGHKMSDLQRQKCSEAHKGLKQSEETKRKRSKAFIGEKSTSAKFTNEQVKLIRIERESTKISIRALSEKYNVSKGCIKDMIYYRSYKFSDKRGDNV